MNPFWRAYFSDGWLNRRSVIPLKMGPSERCAWNKNTGGVAVDCFIKEQWKKGPNAQTVV